MDIVEKLRSPEVLITHGQMISPVAFEAASEIEQLREALSEAIEFADQDDHALTPTGETMISRWRSALQQKEKE